MNGEWSGAKNAGKKCVKFKLAFADFNQLANNRSITTSLLARRQFTRHQLF